MILNKDSVEALTSLNKNRWTFNLFFFSKDGTGINFNDGMSCIRI